MSPLRTPLTVAYEAAASVADDLGLSVAADYGDPAAEERAFTTGAALVDRCGRGAVLVDGPEALTFLNSLLSQDLAVLADGQGTHALLLQPQGKLDTDLRLLRVGDAAWLDCEVGRGDALAASLRRFKIRVKAEVEDRTGDWGCLTLRGPEVAVRVEAAGGPALPAEAHGHVPWGWGTGATRLVRADWPGGPPGADLVGPVGELSGVWTALVAAGFRPAGLSAFEAARVRAGVPRQGLDIDERTIPQEAFLELEAVSFTKGCFLGQELVCRIDTRGHVNRLLRGLVMEGTAEPAVGAEITLREKVVGRVTTVARSPRLGVIALALLRREIEPPAELTVALAA
ncbi:MAG TPA: folate-binding protein, partial [Acidimicrobiia bacterium]|nr:folate-binding protein [Acidimicrobiia bacterium]